MASTLSANAMTVLEKRYLKKIDGKVVETPEEMFRRVAANVAAVETEVYGAETRVALDWQERFYSLMSELEFMPNSPTLMNAGRELQQLAACFVLPVEDSIEGIFESVKNAALIHKSGGGTGFSFSRLRPANDTVLTTGGVASGPVSFMEVFNAATEAVKQGGTRRGANMGILRVDHPDILEFIDCKTDNKRLTNFNISVALTDDFMAALKAGRDYDLISPRDGKRGRRLSAQTVFDRIVEAAWRNGEPGIVYIDRINAANPTPALGDIESTNPCGEQPLLPYEACNLGSINLAKMVTTRSGQPAVDFERLKYVVWVAIRFLDDVIDASSYPLPRINDMVKANRKIGLGVMGFADMLIRLGVPFNTERAVELADEVMGTIQTTAHTTSEELAAERGAFPNFEHSVFHTLGMRPRRNATTTTIAPTGTVSLIAGCSSGVEPLFAVCFERNVLDDSHLVEANPLFEACAKAGGFYNEGLMQQIAERGSLHGITTIPQSYQRLFVTAHEIEADWHVRIQAAFQKHTDNAVSKTINFRQSATKEDMREAYMLAHELGCKGVTVYRDGSRDQQVLTTGATKVDGKRDGGWRPELTPRPRPEETVGITKKYKIGGCGNLYVTVNKDQYGICEVFTNTGEKGCAPLSETLSRLISLALRAGVDVDSILRQLRGRICTGCIIDKDETKVLSCPDAIGKTIEKHLNGFNRFDLSPVGGPRSVEICPEPGCVVLIVHENGCSKCLHCGHSRCG
ncbi:MAG: vitamin B12-dependent ribonucleotide reductase [Dehalococcoidia bacterium]|nr:vitamin B12-dependent ribonucleotide reductase [Dehalococcoidia bacterium]